MANSESLSQFENKSKQSAPSPLTPEELNRVESLKQQKNIERLEKERAIWRDASKPPRVFGEDDLPIPPNTMESRPKSNKGESGFFAKLRLGRFLG